MNPSTPIDRLCPVAGKAARTCSASVGVSDSLFVAMRIGTAVAPRAAGRFDVGSWRLELDDDTGEVTSFDLSPRFTGCVVSYLEWPTEVGEESVVLSAKDAQRGPVLPQRLKADRFVYLWESDSMLIVEPCEVARWSAAVFDSSERWYFPLCDRLGAVVAGGHVVGWAVRGFADLMLGRASSSDTTRRLMVRTFAFWSEPKWLAFADEELGELAEYDGLLADASTHDGAAPLVNFLRSIAYNTSREVRMSAFGLPGDKPPVDWWVTHWVTGGETTANGRMMGGETTRVRPRIDAGGRSQQTE